MTDDLVKRDLVKRFEEHRAACRKALGIEGYTGYSIPEEIERLKNRNSALRAKLERLRAKYDKDVTHLIGAGFNPD